MSDHRYRKVTPRTPERGNEPDLDATREQANVDIDAMLSLADPMHAAEYRQELEGILDALVGRVRDDEKKYREGTQRFVDHVCHYRNLAIKLGAKPENMLGKYDRDLAAQGVSDDMDGVEDTPELWDELEAAEARVRDVEADYDNAHEYRVKYRDALLECGVKRTAAEKRVARLETALAEVAEAAKIGNDPYYIAVNVRAVLVSAGQGDTP